MNRLKNWIIETKYSIRLCFGLETDSYWVGIERTGRLHKLWRKIKKKVVKVDDSTSDPVVTPVPIVDPDPTPDPVVDPVVTPDPVVDPTMVRVVHAEPKNRRKVATWGVSVLAIFAMALLVALVFVAISNERKNKEDQVIKIDNKTWKMKKGDYAHNRWFGDGIAAIRTARTKKSARRAAAKWLDRVKRDPNLLIGAAVYFFPDGKKYTKAQLVKNGWATDKAVQLVSRIQIALGQSRITPSKAPANGTNSGVAGGHVVAAATGGISGDRRAIQIVLPNGKKIWILARCGNPVKIGRPSRHLEAKKWRMDPWAQGNAPIGGGPNADPGPGQYVRPGDMDRPGPGTRTNPPAPRPTWKPTPGATATPTPDPQPTPTPEETVPPIGPGPDPPGV